LGFAFLLRPKESLHMYIQECISFFASILAFERERERENERKRKRRKKK
jgi:hypothetical protein